MKRENWIKWSLDSRLDLPIARLLAEYGIEGYGLYLILVEALCRQDDYKIRVDDDMFIQTYTKLYKTFLSDTKSYKTFLLDVGLLKSDENYIWSDYVMHEMTHRKQRADEISAKRKSAISRRWIQTDTNAIQTDTKPIQTDTNGYKRESKSKSREDINKRTSYVIVDDHNVQGENTKTEDIEKPKRVRKPKKEEPPKTEVAEHIFLTEEQIQKLSAKMTPKEYRYWINNASAYASQNPRAFRQKYRNHFMMILQWRVRRIEDGRIWDEAKASYQMPPKPSFGNNQPREQARHVVPDAEATKKMLESLTKQ